MKLTPRHRTFLEHAAAPGAKVGRTMLSSLAAYWWVRNGGARYELRGAMGDALRNAGFIERADGAGYRITDAGRAAIAEPTDGTTVAQ